jgi:hypothetical protein
MSSLIPLNTKYLHALIYFVANEPTEENLPTPVVGTYDYKTLLKWCGEIDIDITRVRMYNEIDRPFSTPFGRASLNKAVELQQIKVIALGQKAAAYLAKAGIDEFFVLPHPSPKNQDLKDKEYVDNKLGACRTYIYEGVLYGFEKYEESFEEDLSTEQKFPPDSKSGELE